MSRALRLGLVAGALGFLVGAALAPAPASIPDAVLEPASLAAHPYLAGLDDAAPFPACASTLATVALPDVPDAAAAARMRAWGQGLAETCREGSAALRLAASAGLDALREGHAHPDAVRAFARGLARNADPDAGLARDAASLPAQLDAPALPGLEARAAGFPGLR